MPKDHQARMQKIASKVVYQNPWIKVREDEIVWPNGKKGIYGYMEIPATVGVVSVDADNTIVLCRQYRYIFGQESWEVPRGFVDQGETPDQAALRELKEEAGVTATHVQFLGTLKLAIGLLNEEASIFLAHETDFQPDTIDSAEILEVKKFSWNEIMEMIWQNEITDGMTVGAILKAQKFLKTAD